MFVGSVSIRFNEPVEMEGFLARGDAFESVALRCTAFTIALPRSWSERIDLEVETPWGQQWSLGFGLVYPEILTDRGVVRMQPSGYTKVMVALSANPYRELIIDHFYREILQSITAKMTLQELRDFISKQWASSDHIAARLIMVSPAFKDPDRWLHWWWQSSLAFGRHADGKLKPPSVHEYERMSSFFLGTPPPDPAAFRQAVDAAQIDHNLVLQIFAGEQTQASDARAEPVHVVLQQIARADEDVQGTLVGTSDGWALVECITGIAFVSLLNGLCHHWLRCLDGEASAILPANKGVRVSDPDLSRLRTACARLGLAGHLSCFGDQVLSKHLSQLLDRLQRHRYDGPSLREQGFDTISAEPTIEEAMIPSCAKPAMTIGLCHRIWRAILAKHRSLDLDQLMFLQHTLGSAPDDVRASITARG